MKILFLTRLYYPHMGGIEKHISEISKVLIEKGHEVTILTTRYDLNLQAEDEFRGVKIYRFIQPQIKFVGIIKTWIWLVQNISLFKQSDIIHIHDVFIWYWPLKFILPFKKVFITFHGQWGNYPISFRDKFQKKTGALFSDGVICIGDYICKNYGIKAHFVSYGATDMPKMKTIKKQIFLYIGRLDSDTGLPVFLEALEKVSKDKRISPFKIVFCGDGKLKNKCLKYGQVKGWVNPEKHLSGARYVFASGYLTILEGLANKCLMFVAFSNPLQKDYYEMTPFRKYLVISRNSDDLFGRIYYAQKNYKEYENLLEEGYNWVKRLSWKRMASDYLNLWVR